MSDLIKRSDAIATIGVMYERCDTYDITDYRDLMLEAVKVLPSADRPQGEWKDRTYGGRILHPWGESCECSQCEEWGSGAWNFCPNCGARMLAKDTNVPNKKGADE